jgi:hypothetical protein
VQGPGEATPDDFVPLVHSARKIITQDDVALTVGTDGHSRRNPHHRARKHTAYDGGNRPAAPFSSRRLRQIKAFETHLM